MEKQTEPYKETTTVEYRNSIPSPTPEKVTLLKHKTDFSTPTPIDSSRNRRANVLRPVDTRKTGPALLFDTIANGSTQPMELLTIPEVAQSLRVSVPTVRRLQEQRVIPFVKIGGSVRFLASDLRSYVEKARVAAIGK